MRPTAALLLALLANTAFAAPPTGAAAPAPPAASPTGPTLQLPPEQAQPTPPPPLTLNSLLGTGRRLGLGGYGEAFGLLDGADKEVTLRRFVLFAGFRFTDWARLYSELEFENGNEFEVEQAYLEMSPWRWLGFRAGLIVIPLGIINQYHEPPTFLTVDRPLTDQLIIPSTWRELGVGIYGEPIEGLHYQLYGTNGLDADRFTSDAPLVGGRGQGQPSHLNDAAVSGRINFDRVLGLDVGFGFYYGGAGQDVTELGGVQVGVIEADARLKRWGFEARAEYARVFIPAASRITTYQRMTDPNFQAIPRAAEGFYANLGYNVLHLIHRTTQELLPFIGYEYVNPHATLSTDVPAPGSDLAQHDFLVGIDYRPHPQIVLKFDYRRTISGPPPGSLLPMSTGGDADELPPPSSGNRIMFGIGFMF